MTEAGVQDLATSLASDADEDPKRLERDRRRLGQARASLERLYSEMRQDLGESEHRNACAKTRIRMLLREAEHRDREFATARRRIRILLKDAERRDREYANARHRIRLLLNNAERRDHEFARARRQVRILLKDAERRDREYARVRAELRSLRQLSAGLATSFVAITRTRRWRLGNALLSIPSRLLGRRPTTVADDQHALATTLALGQIPRPAGATDHDSAGPGVHE